MFWTTLLLGGAVAYALQQPGAPILESRRPTVEPRSYGDAPDVSGNLLDPAAIYRPRFRYWIPSGHVNPEVVAYDVRQLAEKGFGGAEFLDLVAYGGNDTLSDPTMYGYSSDGIIDAAKAFFETGAAENLRMDWTQGPNQGAGALLWSPDDAGSSTELARGTVGVSQGSNYTGVVPAPIRPIKAPATKTEAIAVVAIKSVNGISNDTILPEWLSDGQSSAPLNFTSVRVLDIADDGTISFSAEDGDYLIFSFWQRPTAARSAVPGFQGSQRDNPASWTTYNVDHFSKTGAQAIIDMQEAYFAPALRASWNESLQYIWEDSIEIETEEMFWTPGFIDRFKQSRGYDPTPYLPFFYTARPFSYTTHASARGSALYIGSDNEQTDRLVKAKNDYYQVLTELYDEYVSAMADWADSLGYKYSAQLAYGQSLDVTYSMHRVDAPEIETLSLNSNITAYRYFSGAQHLTEKRVLSSESAALAMKAYQLSLPEWLKVAHQCYAGGINQHVFHGYAYSGAYETYPKVTGYEPWFYFISEPFGPRQPYWKHIEASTDSMGRSQLLLQSGQPCVDLGVYRFTFLDDNFDPSWAESYQGLPTLETAGYSYEFVVPNPLNGSNVRVEDGILTTDHGPGYKALIVDEAFANLSIPAIERLTELATAGLPIIVSSNFTFGSPFLSETDELFGRALDALYACPTVSRVNGREAVLGHLQQQLSLTPTAHFINGGDNIFTVKRYDKETGIDYYYIYNDGVDSTEVEIAFENHRQQRAYWIDAWTGEVRPVARFFQQADRTHVNISLTPGESKFISLGHPSGDSSCVNVQGVASSELTHFVVEDATLKAHVTTNGSYEVTKTDGSTSIISVSNVPTAITLDTWQLAVQQWVAFPDNATTTGHTLEHVNLGTVTETRWGYIPELTNSSGYGTYSTTFQLPPGVGAWLDLGTVRNSVNVTINGEIVGPINLLNPIIDVSNVIREGNNEISIEVSTLLGNYLRALSRTNYNAVLTNGTDLIIESDSIYHFTFFTASSYDSTYGLVSPVTVQPYVSIDV